MNEYSKAKIKWPEIVIYCVLICASLPKIILAEGANIYIPEIILFSGVLIYGLKQFVFYPEQRYLCVIFSCMLIFSIYAQNSVDDIGAILRSFKELLYIPIIYWASKINNRDKVLRSMVFFGSVAFIINIFFYIANFSISNTIWSGAETLSSGMSNRGINISSFDLEQLPGLAHGIWGSYCMIIFLINLSLYGEKKIKILPFLFTTVLFVVNVTISVSRESLVILLIVLLLYLIMPQKNIFYKVAIIFVAVVGVVGLVYLGSNLPIVQKLTYPADAVSSTGSEGGIQVRINTWQAYYEFLADNIRYLIMGTGISGDNFYLHVKGYTTREIVPTPESAFVYVQAYGGLIATIAFAALVYTGAIKINRNCPYKIVKYFFVGIIVTNALTGVSMFSDLLYAHLCLIYGLLVLNKNNDKRTTYNSESGYGRRTQAYPVPA